MDLIQVYESRLYERLKELHEERRQEIANLFRGRLRALVRLMLITEEMNDTLRFIELARLGR